MVLNVDDIVANRYQVKEKLGEGGMANVYRAVDMRLSRDVTFKVIKEEHLKDKQTIANFAVEAAAAAGLNHTNSVTVYDVGNEGDVHYIAMEYIEGESLKDTIKERAPFDSITVLSIAIQIANALEHAHKNSVVHKDIKPQNILMSKSGFVKVTDFGIASARVNLDMTQAINTMGSAHYFSPEQARGKYLDGRTDIYSLGIVMFEMITGQLPFNGDNTVSIALQHTQDPLPDIRSLNPEASENLVRIIEKATQKQTVNRYKDIEEMLADLKRATVNKNIGPVAEVESPTVKISEEEFSEISEGVKNIEHTNKMQPISKRAQKTLIDLPDITVKEGARSRTRKDKSLEKKIIASAIAFAAIIIGILIFIAVRELNQRGADNILAHDLTGLTRYQAEELYEDTTIRITWLEEENPDIESGTIINQYPEAGAVLIPGANIMATISVGVEVVEIPNVIGETLGNARFILEAFEVLEEFNYHDSYALNTVFAQTEVDGTVVIHVSRGVGQVSAIVPNMVGQTEQVAILQLTGSLLNIGTISRSHSSTVPEGVVMTQTVEPNREVERGTSVGLVISSGPAGAPPAETAAPPPQTVQQTTVPPQTQPQTQPQQASPPEAVVVRAIPRPAEIDDDATTVFFAAVLVTSQGTQTLINETEFDVSRFPLIVELTGTGQGSLQTFIDGRQIGHEDILF